MKNERLEVLLDAYFDENLGPEESAELNFLLLSSAQARAVFWERARFHAVLRRYGSEGWGAWLAEAYGTIPEPTPITRVSLLARFRNWLELSGLQRNVHPWAAASAALVIVGLLGVVLLHKPRSPMLPSPQLAAGTTATNTVVVQPAAAELVRAVNVEWAEATNRIEVGTVLPPGTLKINRGLLEIEFYRGARVVLEGPAEFQIRSDMEAQCLAGKIRVEVPPPAQGFKVFSPSLDVVDVGTSFGMHVQSSGEAEIHVFKGRVDMARTGMSGGQQPLLEGQSARVDSAGQLHSLEASSVTYVSLEDVEHQARAEMKRRYRAWQSYGQTLLEDNSLLVYYDFDGKRSNNRTVLNRATNALPQSHGTVIGCQWSEGRWPGKGALDFKQFGDRVRFSLPTNLSSLTCMAWMRLDGLGHSLNALMMAGNARAGEMQWQLLQTGEILFGKRVTDGWGEGHLEHFRTPPVLMPEDMGLWLHVAVVHDLNSKSVRCYFNGQEVLSQEIKVLTPIILESLEVGNWSPQAGQPIEPVRNFNGRLDEFLIFGRALSAEEINLNYEIGRPL